MARKNEDLEIIEAFSSTFDKFLNDNKYTNTAFAKLLGVDEGTIRKYRTGENLPSHTLMKKITKIMKLRYHELMGYEDPKDTTTVGQE